MLSSASSRTRMKFHMDDLVVRWVALQVAQHRLLADITHLEFEHLGEECFVLQ